MMCPGLAEKRSGPCLPEEFLALMNRIPLLHLLIALGLLSGCGGETPHPEDPGPGLGVGSNGVPGASAFDLCGCRLGISQWHLPSNACLPIGECEPLAGTANECQTPDMCSAHGGR